MLQLSNASIDIWWDDAIPYMDKVDWELHNLSLSLVKYQLLLNNWICILGKSCIYIGYFTFTDRKQFFITLVSGRNLKEEFLQFLDFLRDHFACNSFTGLNISLLGILYKRLLSELGYLTYLDHYEIDLEQIEYFEKLDGCQITLMDIFFIDQWYTELNQILRCANNSNKNFKCDIILHQIISGELFVYRINNKWIVGRVANNLIKKIFYITYMSIMTNQEVAEFFYFLETKLFCRYICYFDDANSQCVITGSNGIIKKQLTTFERY